MRNMILFNPSKSKVKQSKVKQSKAKQSKAKQSKAKQSKAKQSKAKQIKTKQHLTFNPLYKLSKHKMLLFHTIKLQEKVLCAKRTSNSSIITSFLSLCAF